MEVFVIQRVAPGVVQIDSSSFGEVYLGQLWSTCKARKTTKCGVTGDPIKAGDMVYRPVGNAGNRMERILARAIDGARHDT